MQKIKLNLLNKIIKDESLKKLELLFLLFIAKRVDAKGHVSGIYYKDVIKDISCDDSSFYIIKKKLIDKKYITEDKGSKADSDITLLNNSFIVKDEYNNEVIDYRDYLDLNISIFHDKEFYKLKPGAIKLALELLKRVSSKKAITYENSTKYNAYDKDAKRKIWLDSYKDIKSFSKLLGVKGRMIKTYLDSLEKWISVLRNLEYQGNFKTIITIKSDALKRPTYVSVTRNKEITKKSYAERIQYLHFIKKCIRRFRVSDYNEVNLNDTADLISQYKDIAIERGKDIFTVISRAILGSKDMKLNSFNIHALVRGSLSLTN